MNAIDTNILVYAGSADEVVKGPIAIALLDRLNATDTVLPWQVVCELGAVLVRASRRGDLRRDPAAALSLFRNRFPVAMPTPGVLDVGLHIHRHYQVAYWDALLIAACAEAGVDRLYSEDLPSRPEIAGVTVVNPFLE